MKALQQIETECYKLNLSIEAALRSFVKKYGLERRVIESIVLNYRAYNPPGNLIATLEAAGAANIANDTKAQKVATQTEKLEDLVEQARILSSDDVLLGEALDTAESRLEIAMKFRERLEKIKSAIPSELTAKEKENELGNAYNDPIKSYLGYLERFFSILNFVKKLFSPV